MKLLSSLILGIFICSPAWSQASNLIGGFYSSQADASIARVNDTTAVINNPAGVGKIRSNSISTGASSFSSRKAHSRDERSLISTANHVGYVKAFENFNFAAMIYTTDSEFDSNIVFKSFNDREGFQSSYSQNDTAQIDYNLYTVSLAPKDSFWGISFNLLSANSTYLSTTYKNSYENGSPADLSFSASSSATRLNFLAAGLSLGFQYQIKDVIFGARLDSPAFFINNQSHLTLTGNSSSASIGEEASMTAYDLDTKLSPDKNRVNDGRLKLGAAYILDKSSIELNIEIAPAFVTSLNPDKSLNFSYYSKTLGYNFQQNSMSKSSSGSKSTVSPSLGFEYEVDKELKFGAGALYRPSNNKEGEGADLYLVTTGLAHSFQNYQGSYTLFYVKEEDTGGNTQSNLITGEDESADMSYNQIGFLFSGAYFF